MTLQDLRCITAKGVTRGSSLQVPLLKDLHVRFGSGVSPAGVAAEEAAQEAAMEDLADALKTRDEAEKEHAAKEMR